MADLKSNMPQNFPQLFQFTLLQSTSIFPRLWGYNNTTDYPVYTDTMAGGLSYLLENHKKWRYVQNTAEKSKSRELLD